MISDVVKVFVGYDKVESVAWHTMVHSLYRQSSRPLAIVPINLNNLKGIYTRARDPKQSNDFSFSRFLVPYLCNYEGYAIFFDCDMMVRTDICEIFKAIEKEPNKAIYVVKHEYESKEKIKFLNTVQYQYPRKNWSSVMLWNCGHKANKAVTKDFVNNASPLDLHRFTWLADAEIGNLDIRWNWLVGEYTNPPADVMNVHWTLGGPYFKEYQSVDFSEEWFNEAAMMAFCEQRSL